MCILQATACPPLRPVVSVMCERVESPGLVWRATSMVWALQALGILAVRESSLYPSCCLSRCQNAVLLQDLDFWKLIKTCLLWGVRGLWVYTRPLAPLSFPVGPKGLDPAGC